MNRPILIVVIGYIIGILWGLYLKISIVPFYVLLIILYIIINLKYKKKKFKIFSIKRYFRYIKIFFKLNIIITIIISSFISNSIIKIKNYKYENLFNEIQDIELTAIVVSNKKEKEYYDRYQIKVCDEKYKNINLYINVKKQDLEYGDKIQIKGKFIEPQIARNYKGFSYKNYLKTIKIYGTVKVEKIEVIEKSNINKIFQISNSIFLKIRSNIEKTYSPDITPIVLGVMLGDTEQIEDSTKEDFSKSNISHVLAVSGMHILYIIILITCITQKIFGKRKSKIISSSILIIYMFITGFSVSVVRAVTMGVLQCMSFVMYRKSDTLNNIAISALIILINNPYSITGISFILTYGGTLGIIYFNPTIKHLIKGIKIRNRKWKYIFLKIQRKCENIIEIISVSISAQIVIAPISMICFNTFGIAFLCTNLLLSCVIGFIVMGGFIQILVSFISIKTGTALAKLIQMPVYGLIFISKINFGNFKVVTPSLYQIILYYIIVIMWKELYKVFTSKNCTPTQQRIKNTIYLVKYKIRPYSKKRNLIVTCIVILIIIINKIPHKMNIYFIDVEQGDSTLIITPNNKRILIDGGGSSTYDVGKNTLVPYLLDRKIKKIDYVIISHFDDDHVAGVLRVLKEIKVKKVIIGKQFEESENYNDFVKIINEKNINTIVVTTGSRINIEKNVYIDILWPDSSNEITENIINNNALVCKLNYNNFSMLFTGDIEEKSESILYDKYVNSNVLKSTILKVAHHGSKSSSTEKLLNLIKPQIALIGVGANNRYGHPSEEVIKRLDCLRSNNI